MSGSATLLVVDDDAEIRALLAEQLEGEGHRVLQAAAGVDFDHVLAREIVDLVILDLTLPDADGLDLCRALRARSAIPVIMLTARGDPADRVDGLEIGADDYVCKPFEPRELMARVRNMLKRARSAAAIDASNARRIVFGYWTLDVPMRRLIDANDRAVILSATEFRLLRLLIDHAGETLSREQINAMGGSHGDDLLARAVDLQISRIRGKLGDTAMPHRIIATVRNQGYCFMAPIRCS